VVTIFNIFITYGDTFLPSAVSYDELYYELVRCQEVFNNLYSMALRYSMVNDRTVLRIRICFNADPDTDPDPRF
jgi:hypothetical protein